MNWYMQSLTEQWASHNSKFSEFFAELLSYWLFLYCNSVLSVSICVLSYVNKEMIDWLTDWLIDWCHSYCTEMCVCAGSVWFRRQSEYRKSTGICFSCWYKTTQSLAVICLFSASQQSCNTAWRSLWYVSDLQQGSKSIPKPCSVI